MKNTLNIYNDILFLNLRPWIFGKQTDSKIRQLLSEIKEENYKTPPKYEVTFIKPLSNIRKYYQKIIDNEDINYLNELHTAISNTLNKAEKEYIVSCAINKIIAQKMNETAEVINERKYTPEQFDLKRQSKISDTHLADESYILHLLKHHLVRLTMEIQEFYSQYLTEILSPEEIYNKYFNETSPKEKYISDANNYSETYQVNDIKQQKLTKATFKIIKGDIHPGKKDVALYNDIIRNPDRFGRFEEQLSIHQFINENYFYCGKQGYKNKLAIIVHLLIEKNYFNNFNDTERRKITPRDIIKFINHRYDIDIDKQFRMYKNESEKRAKYIDSTYWLYNLLAC